MAASSSSSSDIARVSEQYGYRYVLYNDIVYCPFHLPEKIDELRERFVVEESDVVVATFPKCGTTWMQQIVLLLLFGGDRSKVWNPMKQSLWLETAVSLPDLKHRKTIEELQAMPLRRCWKTHAPEHLKPWKEMKGKIVVVARNPNDAAVSMYHHSRDVATFEYSGPWDHFVTELFLKGLVEHGSFWDWHAGWWAAYKNQPSENQQILWVTYEDLQKDLAGEVARIAKFICVDATPEVLESVVAGSSFSAMKAQFEEQEKQAEVRGEQVKKNHIRQGKSGGWRDVFTEEQAAAFDAKLEELQAKHPDLDFQF
ncbi:Sulfotransferase [Balamuthia mandrillaris]